MKALWFHLMPCPGLDERFDADADSVWADLDQSFSEPSLTTRAYHEYLDPLEDAARAGFDGICVDEHHQSDYGSMPSPNLMAAALARSTRDTLRRCGRRTSRRMGPAGCRRQGARGVPARRVAPRSRFSLTRR